MNELKLLKGFLSSFDETSTSVTSKPWFKVIGSCLYVALGLYALYYLIESEVSIYLVILLSFALGAVYTRIILDEYWYKVWSYMKLHVDRESVKKRIDEINT